MSTNREKIISQYNTGREDGRANISRSSSFEFYYTKKHLQGFIKPNSRVLEIGYATGHYGLYYADKCREYSGVDLVPSHIELFNQKITESGLKNISCQVGDATDLVNIPNVSFDVVLCLGPMYHLPPEERELVLRNVAGFVYPEELLLLHISIKSECMPERVYMTIGGISTQMPRQMNMFWKNALTTNARTSFTSPCRRKWKKLRQGMTLKKSKTAGQILCSQ